MKLVPDRGTSLRENTCRLAKRRQIVEILIKIFSHLRNVCHSWACRNIKFVAFFQLKVPNHLFRNKQHMSKSNRFD